MVVHLIEDLASGAALLDRITDDVIRQLNPQRVLDASCGAGLLVNSFRQRNVDAWGVDFSEAAIACASADVRPYCQLIKPGMDLGAPYDLVICADAPERAVNDGSFLRVITCLTDRLLFASAPLLSGGTLLQAGKRTLEWIELFAAYGLAPNIAFDASFARPHALLLQRRAPLSADVARLFSECIDRRYLAALEQTDHKDTAAPELARYKERSSILEQQLAREHEYLETLRGVHAYLVQEVQRLRAGSAAGVNSDSAMDIETIVARVRSELGPPEISGAEASAGILQLLQQQTALGASVLRLERRMTVIEDSVHELTAVVEGMTQSRIWQAFVSLSGILLRVTGQRRKVSD